MLRIEILLDKLIKEMKIKGINTMKYDNLGYFASKQIAEDAKGLHRGYFYWKQDGALYIETSDPKYIIEKKYKLNSQMCNDEQLVFQIIGDASQIETIVVLTNDEELMYERKGNCIYVSKLSIKDPIIRFNTTYLDQRVTHDKVLCTLKIKNKYKYFSFTEDNNQINIISVGKMKRIERISGKTNPIKRISIFKGKIKTKYKIESEKYLYHRNYLKSFDKSIYEYHNQVIRRWRYYSDEDDVVKQIKIARSKVNNKLLYNSKETSTGKMKKYIRYDRGVRNTLRVHTINYENGREVDRRNYVH